MITLMIVHVANKLARFGKVVRETWRTLPGPTEE